MPEPWSGAPLTAPRKQLLLVGAPHREQPQRNPLSSSNTASLQTPKAEVFTWPQAAKGLGKSLRAFAPTLQELTSVSRDLKNTLDEELGIDEIRREFASARVRAMGFGLRRLRYQKPVLLLYVPRAHLLLCVVQHIPRLTEHPAVNVGGFGVQSSVLLGKRRAQRSPHRSQSRSSGGTAMLWPAPQRRSWRRRTRRCVS